VYAIYCIVERPYWRWLHYSQTFSKEKKNVKREWIWIALVVVVVMLCLLLYVVPSTAFP